MTLRQLRFRQPPNAVGTVAGRLSRRSLIVAGALAVLGSPLLANEVSQKFSVEAFDAAQKAGKLIVVEVYAAWCPVCNVQRPILEDLTMSDRYKDVVYFEIDFDRQKELLRRVNAQKQSTIIVFKGTQEVGRLVGDSKRPSIEALLNKLL